MSQATVHHPSSYGYSGQVGLPATVTGGTAATFSYQSLTPGAHTITWGGGAPTTDPMTVAANGVGSAAHTYPAGPGTYVQYVTEDATSRRVAQRTITLPYSGGAGFAPRDVQPEQLSETVDSNPEPEQQDLGAGFDPAAHTVQEVEDFVLENPDQAESILALEEEGKGRVTLITWLESQV